MVKQYSEMTHEELVARIAELEDELREAWEDAVHCGGYFSKKRKYKGWWGHSWSSASILTN